MQKNVTKTPLPHHPLFHMIAQQPCGMSLGPYDMLVSLKIEASITDKIKESEFV